MSDSKVSDAEVWAVYHMHDSPNGPDYKSWDYIGDEVGARAKATRCNELIAKHGLKDAYVAVPLAILAERQQAANPCSLSEALNVLENLALRGNTLSGDDVPRFQALVSKIAPAAKGVTDEMVSVAEFARKSAHASMVGRGASWKPGEKHKFAMRAAIEAIAPMLANRTDYIPLDDLLSATYELECGDTPIPLMFEGHNHSEGELYVALESAALPLEALLKDAARYRHITRRDVKRSTFIARGMADAYGELGHGEKCGSYEIVDKATADRYIDEEMAKDEKSCAD
jgi:hypothetical protein